MYKSIRKGKVCYQNNYRISHQAKLMENYKNKLKIVIQWKPYFKEE